MCGIVGYVRLNPDNKVLVTEISMANALDECSLRGNQATGFYTPKTGTIKDGIGGKAFAEKYAKKIANALKEPVFVGHCRAATNGIWDAPAPPSINDNNHPHEGERYVLVHNGHFSHLPLVKGYKYKGTCDSELALSYIETFGIQKGIGLFSRMDGFSLVVYDKEEKEVYWYRESNPLVYSFDILTESILFGSTTGITLKLGRVFPKYNLQKKATLQSYETESNALYCLKTNGEGISDPTPIKLRLNDEALKEVPKTIQAKLEIDDFFAEKNREFSSIKEKYMSRGSNSHNYNTTTGGTSTQTTTRRSASSNFSIPLIYTILTDGILKLHGPLMSPGESTQGFLN